MTALLSLDGLGKTWFGVSAVKDLTLDVAEGRLLGLIGQNGAGKSTLMNMIGGVVQPSSGAMRWRGAPYAPQSAGDAARTGIAFIHQELNLFTNLSVAENLYIDGFPRRFGLIDWSTIRRRSTEILRRLALDLDPDTPIGRLSPGERQLVEIAKALHNDAQLIIFDEPTTSLTLRETARLFETIAALRAEGRTIIYISHILGDVQQLADDIGVLRDGQLVDSGPAAEFTVQRMIRSMIGRDLGGLYPPRSATPGSATVLEARGLTQPGVLQDVSLTVRAGELVGLFGLMGAGRSELARILCAAVAGTIMIAQIGRLDAGFGEGREFDVIAAAVLGGASLFGGVGSVWGAVLGATLIQTVKLGRVFTGVNLYLQPMMQGLIILIAVLADGVREKRLRLLLKRRIRPAG
ncbi:ATP-binding cassette domain-containing protein [Rhodobacter calidifons]|uniref:ATP-binding cassette domain-containing protein n=1 Tax=Rhodobacter calidifons TaxID=2715277 RepID=A0ABX0G2T6_9RHOB|nr:ATP-binding cassette domain-containing protein [Rhodobacter calidifons]NHB75396.1 ATP-binding cassette domain-containing protein [Rhodobacter calidifons]